MHAYRVTLIVGGGGSCGMIFRSRDCKHIATFDMHMASVICTELNQAAHAAAASKRKERTMKKAKPMPKPTKPGKKKGC